MTTTNQMTATTLYKNLQAHTTKLSAEKPLAYWCRIARRASKAGDIQAVLLKRDHKVFTYRAGELVSTTILDDATVPA